MRVMRIVTILGLLVLAPLAMADPAEEKAVQETIKLGYVDGVWRLRQPELVRQHFAPTFVMQVHWKGELSSRTLDDWLARMKLDGKPRKETILSDVKVLDITGGTAVVKVNLYEDTKLKYTDYFGLYKTKDGWKIVSKFFHGW